MNPLATVVVPAFNAEDTLAATLASASAQTLAEIEIIVVDDGSTDRTAEIVRAAAAGDPRIRLLTQENAGPAVARNLAITHGVGRFVAPLDADDLWRPDYLTGLVAALERSSPPAGFAYALHQVVDEQDMVILEAVDFGVEGIAFHRHLLVNFVGNGSSAVFRRDALEQAGGYDPITRGWGGAEDYLLQLRIAAKWPVARVGVALVGYRRRKGSYSSDPLLALRARKSAVDQAGSAFPDTPAAVNRWVEAEAARIAAASLLKRGAWRRSLMLSCAALVTDPLGTASELLERVGNLAARRRAPPQGPRRGFSSHPPLPARRVNPITRGRLARLERLDQVLMRQLGARDGPNKP